MSEKKKSGFWADFKAFITRGNVVDMAVGVVIGGAFGKIVTGLVNYIINPCVSLLTDGTDLDNIKTVLRKGVEATETTEAVPEVAILWGTWIQTILDFLLVAFCIFLVLRVLMRAKNRLEAKKIAEAEAAAAAAKAEADAAAAAAKAAEEAVAARQTAVEDAILRQEKLLAELVETVKSK
jgi:large conductance mechanosensitive channel